MLMDCDFILKDEKFIGMVNYLKTIHNRRFKIFRIIETSYKLDSFNLKKFGTINK